MFYYNVSRETWKGVSMYLLYFDNDFDTVFVGVTNTLDEAKHVSADYYDVNGVVLSINFIDNLKPDVKDFYRVVTVYSKFNNSKYAYYKEHYTHKFTRVEMPKIVGGRVQFIFSMIVPDGCTDITIENTANRVFKVMSERYVSGFYDNVR